MLVTAFSLDGPSRRRAMQKKYDNRVHENAIAAPLRTANDLLPRMVDEAINIYTMKSNSASIGNRPAGG